MTSRKLLAFTGIGWAAWFALLLSGCNPASTHTEHKVTEMVRVPEELWAEYQRFSEATEWWVYAAPRVCGCDCAAVAAKSEEPPLFIAMTDLYVAAERWETFQRWRADSANERADR